MTAFDSVINSIGNALSDYEGQDHKIIVNKSTVPIGTALHSEKMLKAKLNQSQANFDELFTIVSMPEFLAEG